MRDAAGDEATHGANLRRPAPGPPAWSPSPNYRCGHRAQPTSGTRSRCVKPVGDVVGIFPPLARMLPPLSSEFYVFVG